MFQIKRLEIYRRSHDDFLEGRKPSASASATWFSIETRNLISPAASSGFLEPFENAKAMGTSIYISAAFPIRVEI